MEAEKNNSNTLISESIEEMAENTVEEIAEEVIPTFVGASGIVGAFEPQEPVNMIILGGDEAYAHDYIEYWKVIRLATFHKIFTHSNVSKPAFLQGSSIAAPSTFVEPGQKGEMLETGARGPISKQKEAILYELFPWAKNKSEITKYTLYKFVIKKSGMIQPFIGYFNRFLTWVSSLSYSVPELAKKVMQKKGAIKVPCKFLTPRPKKHVIYNPQTFYDILGSYINEIKDIYKGLGLDEEPENVDIMKMNLLPPEKYIDNINGLIDSWKREKLAKEPEILIAEEISMYDTLKKIEEYYTQLFRAILSVIMKLGPDAD